MRYNELPTEPPAYDLESQRGRREEEGGSDDDGDSLVMEEMEMLDSEEMANNTTMRERITRARDSFRHKVIFPVQTGILDPIAEGYAYFARRVESYMAKIGNPLIVKRFAYVIFIGLVVWVIAASGFIPQDHSRQSGSFSDRTLLEEFVRESVDLKSMEENLEYLSSMEHMAGTQGDLSLARYIEAYYKQKGLHTIEFQETLTTLNFPNRTVLSYEGAAEIDLSQQFNPLSKQGNAEGGLIYVHYGRRGDFETLEKSDVTTKSNVCLIKYGAIPTSQKIMIAESFGCTGLLFISETADFPDSYERRSAGIPEFYTGDPYTPGWSSGTNPERLKTDQISISKIPSVSLTRTQAQPLLEKLHSKGVKFDDHDQFYSGDGSFHVKLSNQVVYKNDHEIWNVLGKIEGKEQGDKALVIGAQRDAPCNGAIFPNTGTVIMLELIEILNKMRYKFNWEPLRSIYFISFDGSEYNFAGATELIERSVHQVQKETAVYLDLSEAVAGNELQISSDAILKSMFNEYEKDYNIQFTSFEDYGNFIPFMVQGIPTIDIGFKNGGNYGKYTCQDTFQNFQDLQIDEGFEKHRVLVELVMKIVLKIIEDPLLPFDLLQFVETLNDNFKDLQKYANDLIPDGGFNFEPIMTGLLKLKQLGKDLDLWKKAWLELLEDDGGVEPSLLSVHRWNWNSRLNLLEKLFLSDEGLPGRSWYKNILIGPQLFKPDGLVGRGSGDGGEWFSFPGVRDAIYFGMDVQNEINRVGEVLIEGCRIFVEG